MDEEISLRVKCKKSQKLVVEGIWGRTTLAELLQLLSTSTSIPVPNILLLHGFPPKKINLTPAHLLTPIANLHIQNQDTLIVQEQEPPISTPTGPGTQSETEQRIGTSVPLDPLDQGLVLRKVVPSDNCCLFRSILYCTDDSLSFESNTAVTHLRSIISNTVLQNTQKYTEGFLGRSNRSYADWILKEDSWGGGIELSILSDYFQLEIVVMDIQNLRLNRFGEDRNFGLCVLLLYDGIHYDPLYWEAYDGSRTLTKFPTKDGRIFEMVRQLGAEAKASHQYTDTKNFSLRCRDCNEKIGGNAGVQKHAKDTGHIHFDEIQEHNYL